MSVNKKRVMGKERMSIGLKWKEKQNGSVIATWMWLERENYTDIK